MLGLHLVVGGNTLGMMPSTPQLTMAAVGVTYVAKESRVSTSDIHLNNK